MNYGKALRISRAIAGLEQKELASTAGLDPSHISLIESGSRKPSVGAIQKICRALAIPEPLFTMLAAEAADLRGIDQEEFERIGAHLTKFLLRGNLTGKNGERKHRRKS